LEVQCILQPLDCGAHFHDLTNSRCFCMDMPRRCVSFIGSLPLTNPYRPFGFLSPGPRSLASSASRASSRTFALGSLENASSSAAAAASPPISPSAAAALSLTANGHS
jgi:hypothetical protein